MTKFNLQIQDFNFCICRKLLYVNPLIDGCLVLPQTFLISSEICDLSTEDEMNRWFLKLNLANIALKLRVVINL